MLRITNLTAKGYRSIRDIWFPVDPVGVFVGGNGVGKSNLYRALQLMQGAATGTLALDIASEGGMNSALWAGERKPGEPPTLYLEADIADEGTGGSYRYAIEVCRARENNGFDGEPQVLEESLTFHFSRRPTVLLERKNRSGWAVDVSGKRHLLSTDLLGSETALSALQDAVLFPDLHMVRRALSMWRFHHGFRTDAEAPMRRPSLAVAAPTLAQDGSNLAAVIATLVHLRSEGDRLRAAVSDAFPGAGLWVPAPTGHAVFGLQMPGFERPFEASELSDGTLRYIALAGALLSFRSAPFIALNEPETSLHPSMMRPLGRLIADAAQRSQVWLVTHSHDLAEAIAEECAVPVRSVTKRDGATWIEGLGLSGFDGA